MQVINGLGEEFDPVHLPVQTQTAGNLGGRDGWARFFQLVQTLDQSFLNVDKKQAGWKGGTR